MNWTHMNNNWMQWRVRLNDQLSMEHEEQSLSQESNRTQLLYMLQQRYAFLKKTRGENLQNSPELPVNP